MRDSSPRVFRKVVTVFVMALLALGFSAVFLISPANAESLGSWTPTTSYPGAVYNHSCASYSGYVYCVAGGAASSGNGVYYAQASSSGVGAWTSTTTYPSFIGGLSCATYSGYIYCVGGNNISGTIDNVNYAPISSSGVGTWTSTTAYPSAITDQSCAISSGYIYCVGGTSDSLAGITGHVEYAPVSSSGVGTWTQSTGYPFPVEDTSCFIAAGYLYCVAGFALSGYTSVVYYAPISASGVGTWTATTYYPDTGGYLSCATSYGVVYCVDGTNSDGSGYTDAVYYGLLSTPGVISWTSTSNYPLAVVGDSCVASSGVIICTGGVGYGTSAIDNTYYASISPPPSSLSSWNPTTSYPAAVYNQACAADSGYIYCVAGGAASSGNAVYYAPITSSGVGTWTATASYPSFIGGLSCATYSGYIYCVGGNNISGTIDNVYYASLSPSGGISGSWQSTTVYPSAITDQSCAISSGYIYCVGGTSDSLAGITGHVEYAPVSSSGVGTWTQSTGYPFPVENTSCFIYSGTIYCVAGFGLAGYSSVVYYATASSSGVGAWTATTYYPDTGGYLSCTDYAGTAYCVDGTNPDGSGYENAVFYATTSPFGVGTWNVAPDYPLAVIGDSCIAASSVIACIGGVGYGTPAIANAYYASISPPGVTVTSTATTTTTTTATTTLTSTVTTPTTTTSTTTATTTSTSTSTATTTLPPIITTTTTTTNVIATSTTTSTTTVATEGSLETTILANQGTFNSGDTIASLLYGLQSSLTSVGTSLAGIVSSLTNVQSSLTTLQNNLASLSSTITSDFGSVASTLATVQSSITTLQSGLTSLSSTVSSDFTSLGVILTSVESNLATLQANLTSLTTNVTNGFAAVDSSLSSMGTTLNSIQTSVNNLSTQQSHGGLAGSASGESKLTSSAPTATIYTTSNGKVAIVAVSVNATSSGGLGNSPGPVVIRYYTDPAKPTLYVQQTVNLLPGNPLGNGDGYLGTGAAWKVVLVATFPAHGPGSTSSVTADWAVSSTGPQ